MALIEIKEKKNPAGHYWFREERVSQKKTEKEEYLAIQKQS